MENIPQNTPRGKPRFSLPAGSIPHSRCTPTPSPGDSTDDEWGRLQSQFEEDAAAERQLEEQLNGIMASDDSVVQRLDFDSPKSRRISLGTIATKREELRVVRELVELDDEIEYLRSELDIMEENFKNSFGQATKLRLISETRNNSEKLLAVNKLNIFSVIDALSLEQYPHIEWARRIEDALLSSIH